MRWFWVNFQYRGILQIWTIVAQGPTALTVVAGGDCSDIFYILSPTLWEAARYRLKNYLKGSNAITLRQQKLLVSSFPVSKKS